MASDPCCEAEVWWDQDIPPGATWRDTIEARLDAAAAVVTAVAGGVAVNLLTAPQAAVTLAERLRPILERLVQFFL